jgi:hypothetical protein
MDHSERWVRWLSPLSGCKFARLYRPAVTSRRRMRAAVERILAWDCIRRAGVVAAGEEHLRSAKIPNRWMVTCFN